MSKRINKKRIYIDSYKELNSLESWIEAHKIDSTKFESNLDLMKFYVEKFDNEN